MGRKNKEDDRIYRRSYRKRAKYKAYQAAYQSTPKRALAKRDRMLQRTYDITVVEYNSILGEQGELCAICRKPERRKKYLAVDHDHQTKEVRGLLCVNCNLLLGNAQDCVLILESAIRYLEKGK